ncbi:MAG: acyclic terpene utilization AtuA family protein [Pseudomonadota bacterium]
MNETETVLIGCAAGFAGDRLDAGEAILDLFETRAEPRWLMYECLAERTLALAQLAKAQGGVGYSAYLDRYLKPILPRAMSAGVRIVSNLGAADPLAGARRVHELAAEAGLTPPRVAAVLGDDLRALMSDEEIRALPLMDGAHVIHRPIIAANAYLGAGIVAKAAATGADVILTGRTTDSALALGPLMHEYGWATGDYRLMATGVICGHLLECGGQVTGAYFADPGFKDVPDLAHVGFPVAEVSAGGRVVIGKPPNTGGCVTRATVTEQLLYEMHDPAAYLTPDAAADITAVKLAEDGPDRIAVEAVRGAPPPGTLKATVSVENGWLGEAEMSYLGPGARARAALAAEVVETRLSEAGVEDRLGVELLGAGGGFGRGTVREWRESEDIRLRLALISDDKAAAQLLIDELQALYCSGPAAGGGFRSHLTAQMATASVLVPREVVERSARVEVLS